MKVPVRADSSQTLGHGHVMRCLTLSSELKRSGADVTFLLGDLPGNARDVVAAAGYDVRLLAGALSEADDAAASLAAVDGPFDLVVVDNYRLGAAWERALRSRTRQILVIDDLAD